MKASTLDAKIISGRRCGNTTRQVDFAIQALFDGKTVSVLDHYMGNNLVHKLLLDKIMNRLRNEHGITKKDIVLTDNGSTKFISLKS